MKLANRAAAFKAALCSSAAIGLLAAAPAFADSQVLAGDYITIGLNEKGTLGYNGGVSPGILYDGTGTGTFNTSYDYLTPGSPFEGFVVAGTGGGSAFSIGNNNAFTATITGGTLTNYNGAEYNGTTYDRRAVWTATVADLFTITNDYYFNVTDQQVNITTSITALSDLTGLSFSRELDPDAVAAAGDSSATNNYLGNGAIPATDLVYAEALVSKYVIGLYTDTTYEHNAAVTGWSRDTASYLAGTNVGNGDNTIGLGFSLGDLLSGSSLSFDYSYIFGTDIAAAVGGVGNITGDNTTSDLLNGAVLPVIDGGTLTVDAADSYSSDIAVTSNNGTIDTNGFDAALTGVISGDGGITKTGAGTLVLTGANSYTGGTTIADGTLVGTTTSIQGAVTNDAALIIDQDSDGTLGSTMSGTGSFTKDGSGTVVLTGTNSYTGGTTVLDGSLVGTTASLQGDVANSGTVVFDQTTDGTYSGAVSGSGMFAKTGFGTLTLTGANTYTGGTVVTGGTLAGDTSSLQGPILNTANVEFDQATAGAYSGSISGTGTLTKTGAGSLNLTGTSDYTGATTVDEGRLAVNGSIAGSVVTVNSGGTMGGNGTVGGLIVRTGATAAPGNSIGHLHVASDLTFEVGSTYAVEVNAAGAGDRISTTGVATIEGGTVEVLAEAGDYKPQGRYVILTADGGVSGTFDDVTSNFAFLVPTLSYSANGVLLTLTRNDVTFAGAGTTANQIAVGTAIDGTFVIGTPIYDALVGSSTSEIGSGLDALSGEIHASTLSVAADDAANLRRTLLERARSAAPSSATGGKIALWADVGGNWNDKDGNANAAKVSASGYRFVGGVELSPSDSVKLGLAGGTAHQDVTVARRASTADLDEVYGAIYAAAGFGPLTLRAGASYTDLDTKTKRAIDYRSLEESLDGKGGGSVKQVFGEAGYVLPLGAGSIEPFAGFNALWLTGDRFRETGGTAALKGSQRTQGYGWTSAGLRMTLGSATAPVAVRTKVAWEHATSDVDVGSRVAFQQGGSSFIVEGAPLSRDSVNLDAAIEWRATSAFSLGAGYTGSIGSRGEDHGIRASATVRF
ncbi:autotransporter outer membrane beta-barrel domain-containing protein [Novosphingobium clariflavum]|uniref:Autotransporter domain-containing protein n=1 Tax=Novosphingobium clariflavum TaxID=2029884 RepID=A0ABV6SCE7_9SPHN|nr:autotransporter domain-containing protein [Novosphingobium clariflavum]